MISPSVLEAAKSHAGVGEPPTPCVGWHLIGGGNSTIFFRESCTPGSACLSHSPQYGCDGGQRSQPLQSHPSEWKEAHFGLGTMFHIVINGSHGIIIRNTERSLLLDIQTLVTDCTVNLGASMNILATEYLHRYSWTFVCMYM